MYQHSILVGTVLSQWALVTTLVFSSKISLFSQGRGVGEGQGCHGMVETMLRLKTKCWKFTENPERAFCSQILFNFNDLKTPQTGLNEKKKEGVRWGHIFGRVRRHVTHLRWGRARLRQHVMQEAVSWTHSEGLSLCICLPLPSLQLASSLSMSVQTQFWHHTMPGCSGHWPGSLDSISKCLWGRVGPS